MSTDVQLLASNATDDSWVEVWIDAGYVLLLHAKQSGCFAITDPKEGGRTIETFDSYEPAMFWLREDEYERTLRWAPQLRP
jgi:hypothetical protein